MTPFGKKEIIMYLCTWKSRARLTPEGEVALPPENVFILTP